MAVKVDSALPEGDEKVRSVRAMFDAIAPRYDVVNRIMTFRMDVAWRRRTIRELALSPTSRILDLACGTGDFCRELTKRGLEPIGVDFSWGMLAAARTDAPLVQGDALCLPVPPHSVDGVTCGFALRNFVELAPFFAELARVIRAGGRIALLEVDRFVARQLADVIVAPSQEMRDTFVDIYGCDPDRVEVIEHGLDLSRFDPAIWLWARPRIVAR